MGALVNPVPVRYLAGRLVGSVSAIGSVEEIVDWAAWQAHRATRSGSVHSPALCRTAERRDATRSIV